MMIIRVCDLETSGLTPPEAAPCEIGWTDVVRKDGGWFVGLPTSVLCHPGHPIPPEASAIHHLTDRDVAGCEPWGNVCKRVADEPDVTHFAAHSAKFESQWLTSELLGRPIICTYKAAMHLWPDFKSHSNQSVRYNLGMAALPAAFAMPVHRSGPDSYVTALILSRMLNNGISIETLIEWTNAPILLKNCRLPKHFGKTWEEVARTDIAYLHWINKKPDFDEDTAHTVKFWIWKMGQGPKP